MAELYESGLVEDVMLAEQMAYYTSVWEMGLLAVGTEMEQDERQRGQLEPSREWMLAVRQGRQALAAFDWAHGIDTSILLEFGDRVELRRREWFV